MHNVFPGNTFSSNELPIPFSKEGITETNEVNPIYSDLAQMSTRNAFKARIVPFSRAKEALKLVEKDIDFFKEEERSQLKQALEELERSLAQIRAKL